MTTLGSNIFCWELAPTDALFGLTLVGLSSQMIRSLFHKRVNNCHERFVYLFLSGLQMKKIK